MWLIITLILLGAVLLVAEMVLLPGFTVAGIGSVAAYIAAGYFAFANYGTRGGFLVVGVIVAISVVAIAVSLNARTWRRFSLRQNVEGVSQPSPSNELAKGDRGIAITRLAPMGKVMVGDETYEAKSLGDKYLDEHTQVEVVGFENFSVIVKRVE